MVHSVVYEVHDGSQLKLPLEARPRVDILNPTFEDIAQLAMLRMKNIIKCDLDDPLLCRISILESWSDTIPSLEIQIESAMRGIVFAMQSSQETSLAMRSFSKRSDLKWLKSHFLAMPTSYRICEHTPNISIQLLKPSLEVAILTRGCHLCQTISPDPRILEESIWGAQKIIRTPSIYVSIITGHFPGRKSTVRFDE